MSVILDTIVNFLARAGDRIFTGRNRTRIIMGTDRKDTKDSGYGENGEDDPESGTLDFVAGYDPSSSDQNLRDDKSRLYISGKTDPDDYFGIDLGDKAEGEPAMIQISDNIYLKSRKRIKILNDKFSILVKENGEITIKSDQKIVFDSSNIRIGDANASEVPAWASKVFDELSAIDRTLKSLTGGSTAPAEFLIPYVGPPPASALGATKTKIS